MPDVLQDLSLELCRARELYPSADGNVLGLMEEFGELAQAINQMQRGKGRSRYWVYRAGIQAMAMVVRLLEEGDPAVGIHTDRLCRCMSKAETCGICADWEDKR